MSESLIPKRVVIPAAGIGTRLLSATKETPKEMLPIFAGNSRAGLCLKPLLQLIFEQLHSLGFREFCFIVGRGKRAIEDHFTPDWSFVESLKRRGKSNLASSLESFYEAILNSKIVWVNQPEPRGFGHAVLMAEPFVIRESFLVCAGDTYIISRGNDHLKRMIKAYTASNADAILLLQEVDDPRQYGVALVEEAEGNHLKVLRVVEKPKKPPSNLAIMPLYAFKPIIFDVLRDLPPGVGNEIQLTDGIQKLIDLGHEVKAVKLREDEIRLDIGTPETYWEALSLSYKHFKGETFAKSHNKK